ncbi:hypothetical protein CN445_24895 [Bacillus cereus]|uniref:hypothetical protein n=1 Tax=Bacillus nitratireducens TaxID=2026193 RepID=UPI0001A11614|nr:hypothetical protein [Bacillus nitratireducens]EEL84606.1 hypothetical protein bcere0029_56710 [Bacillus cereus AH1272]EEL90768.1 hypothetical protein bcere0030_52720 [Bacillus cereus AH1273]PEB78890.1 hypothetical protein COM95_24765 [Bacillus cereus]OJD37322.1 hypothetical protein BAU23_26730 [Bacillus nitratireducens]PEW83365.1 hypothetical protein CN445_24895 [Bacillus cereus]
MDDKQYELLKYQIELLKKMVNVDENPLYDYMIDYNISREQHNIFIDILSVFSLQLKRQSEQLAKDGVKYFEAHKESMLSKYSHLDTTVLKELSLENAPTYEAFSSLINKFLPEDVESLTLLKRTNRQGIYTDVCDYLISESQK